MAKKTKEQERPKRVTIKGEVERIYRAKPNTTPESLVKQITKKFPTSAFDATHVSYYCSLMRDAPYNIKIPIRSKHTPKKAMTKKKPAKKKAVSKPAKKKATKAKASTKAKKKATKKNK